MLVRSTLALMFTRLSFKATAVTEYVHQGADLVQELPDFNYVSVEVDVPQRPRCLTGVFEPPSNTLI